MLIGFLLCSGVRIAVRRLEELRWVPIGSLWLLANRGASPWSVLEMYSLTYSFSSSLYVILEQGSGLRQEIL